MYALKKDTALITAAAREVSVAEYVALLEQRVCEGYWQAGYGQVRAVATVDRAGGGRVVLEIDEGLQFNSGAVEVSGVSPELGERGASTHRLSQYRSWRRFANDRLTGGTAVPLI